MDDDGGGFSPELRDLEAKLGRKVPDGLVRALLAGGKRSEFSSSRKLCADSADLERLQSKMLLLRQEMANLRAIDVKLMQQLMSINEGIESVRWLIEDKGDAASQDGSLTGSLYSLSDSQDGSSPRGSLGSLTDANGDGLDGLSVGSYLDTLADELADAPSPAADLDRLVDKSVLDGDAFATSPLTLRVEADEYYCFR
ncbi:leucine rich adaptor protein 1-like [Kryptolebias marmoratus]|uniref:Leucine rich adaptor protein 1 like n=1 Tax=Kryptolebias marmoratus TaxID=37003 RepID=A0A3Q2ZVK3_KRYMA|nr:leucine rich adaptor protein 1-like [Kryptolebias marmoratus]